MFQASGIILHTLQTVSYFNLQILFWELEQNKNEYLYGNGKEHF